MVFDQALKENQSIEEAERICENDQWTLYRMNWAENIHFLTKLLLEYEGAVLLATAVSNGWCIRHSFRHTIVFRRLTTNRARTVCRSR